MASIVALPLRCSLVLVAAALAGPGAPASAASMKCEAAATPVEKAICANPALVAADSKMAAAFARRLDQCPESARAELRQTQRFWLRDRNACSNALSEDDPEAVARCAADRMNERIGQIERIGAACDLNAVAEEYRYVDTAYLAAHAYAYDKREVSVAGGIRMGSCNARSEDLTAKLASEPGKADFPVRFKSLSALQREWLCAQRPVSSWKGMVRNEGGVVFLYLSDLLGEPL